MESQLKIPSDTEWDELRSLDLCYNRVEGVCVCVCVCVWYIKYLWCVRVWWEVSEVSLV